MGITRKRELEPTEPQMKPYIYIPYYSPKLTLGFHTIVIAPGWHAVDWEAFFFVELLRTLEFSI